MINITDKHTVDETINSMRRIVDELSNALWNARMYDSAYEFRTKMENACADIKTDLYNVFEKFTEALSEKTKECLSAGELDEPKSTANTAAYDGTELFEPFINETSDDSSDCGSTEVKGTFAELLGNGLKSLGKCLNDMCNTSNMSGADKKDDMNAEKNTGDESDFCKTAAGEPVSMASDLMREYDEEQIECSEDDTVKNIDPTEISKAVIDVVSDRKAHKYRFIKGDGGAAPAVEVIISDSWNIRNRPEVVQLACDDIKNIGDFSLVSMSATANPGKLTFFLVLK